MGGVKRRWKGGRGEEMGEKEMREEGSRKEKGTDERSSVGVFLEERGKDKEEGDKEMREKVETRKGGRDKEEEGE